MGVNGVVFKAHGSSDALAFSNAILAAAKYKESGINEKIKELVPQTITREEETED